LFYCFFFEIYQDLEVLKNQLQGIEEKVQCILSKDAWYENSIPFGQAQCPKLDDYADGVDTIEFLLKLK
jgi:hypothetical protein